MLINEDFFDNDIDIEVSQTENTAKSFEYTLTIPATFDNSDNSRFEKSMQKFDDVCKKVFSQCRQIESFDLLSRETKKYTYGSSIIDFNYGINFNINNARDAYAFLTLFVFGPFKKLTFCVLDKPFTIMNDDEDCFIFRQEEWTPKGEKWDYSSFPVTIWKYSYLEEWFNQENDIYNFCNFLFKYKYLNKYWLFLKDIGKDAPFVYMCINDGLFNNKIDNWKPTNDFISNDIHRIKTNCTLHNVTNPDSEKFNKSIYCPGTMITDISDMETPLHMAGINDISSYGENSWIKDYCQKNTFTVYIVDNIMRGRENIWVVYFVYDLIDTNTTLVCLHSLRDDKDEKKLDMLSCAMSFDEANEVYKKYAKSTK